MADEGVPGTPEGMINARLERDLQQAEKERDAMRALLARPTTVNIQAPEESVLKDIGLQLPKISQISEHLATMGGEMMKAAKAKATREASLDRRLDRLADGIERIADVLDRLAPVPADLGADDDESVTGRVVHVDNGHWSTPPVWADRVCKRYGMAWTVFDPGPNDPTSAGDSCSLEH